MAHFIHTVMTALFITLALSVTPARAANEAEKVTIQLCVNTGLPKIIAGEEIARYISLNNFSLNAIGKGNWDSLSIGEQEELKVLVLATIEKKARAEIKKQAASGIDLTKTAVIVKDVALQTNGLYRVTGTVISPSGIPYSFKSQVNLNGQQCTLHSIIVEDSFSIAQDIGGHPDITAFMKLYKLKR